MQTTISPVDGSIYVERETTSSVAVDEAFERARVAQAAWKQTSLTERSEICSRFVDEMMARRHEIAIELTWQMGRPIAQTPGELDGMEERARHMIAIATAALGDIAADEKDGFERLIRREPLGVVFVLAPWNYPYLTSINSLIPAVMAGNSVVIKHSSQTPLCAERYAEAFAVAGLPADVFQYLHTGHDEVARIIATAPVDYVAFTGSVDGGHAVQQALSSRFIGAGLELGGKDPAYVREDADLGFAVENIVDGAFFNSGQSCCGIERVYVHESVFDEFVEGAVELAGNYRLGDPTDPNTNLGPLVRISAADFVRRQVAEAIEAGASALIDPAQFPADQDDSPYLAPQILVDVDHTMSVMRDESFGPVVGVMKVGSDDEALRLMNDSEFGLTASLWTVDRSAATELGTQIEAGTVFMNRCDYLDPALAWTGVKNSGRGCTLSSVGYEQLTRPKSFNFRLST